MRFSTLGDPTNPAILFFHAMGVVGESGERVAKHLADQYYCVMPTSTVYCENQRYAGRADEAHQVEEFLRGHGVDRLALVVASPSAPIWEWRFSPAARCRQITSFSMGASLRR